MNKMNILATAAALSDQDLLARLDVLTVKEREASVELVAHLAALDTRPSLYAGKGYGSLISYCTQALGLSEDAACNRIEAARACRRFPMILDLLASGAMTLTSVRLLRRHLTPENHQAVLARARGRSLRQIDALVAELAPRPDVPSSVRKLPTLTTTPAPATPILGATSVPSEPPLVIAPSPPVFLPRTTRPIVQATAPERYRVQFTIGEQTHEKLRRVQALLRREIPDGDPGAIFDRALTLLLAKVENTKLGKTDRPRPKRSIRRETDNDIRTPSARSRDIPRAVRRAVWKRDGGHCAFISPEGRRCTERSFLEFHHLQAYAKQGPATVENIALHCRRHNQYEAELVFGPHGASIVGERRGVFAHAFPENAEQSTSSSDARPLAADVMFTNFT
jgi:5-methylcytosine-specific restriction endonuclease McrA